jgi:hypothetical protein
LFGAARSIEFRPSASTSWPGAINTRPRLRDNTGLDYVPDAQVAVDDRRTVKSMLTSSQA